MASLPTCRLFKQASCLSALSVHYMTTFLLFLLIYSSEVNNSFRFISPVSSLVTGTNLGGKFLFGAVINTDPMIASVLGRDFHKVPQGVNGTQKDNAVLRIENSRSLVKQLPFNVDSWLSIYAPHCPDRPSKGNDRGVMMAHFQIWHDFVVQREKAKGQIDADKEVIVVFEDDAVIAVKNVTWSLETELIAMNSDLLFLGWCYGRRGMPMCTHAYALTRTGAKKMINNWDICSMASIDGQWKHLHHDGVFTWKKAEQSSYSNLRDGFEDNPHYFTRGIFIQKGGLVSFNHHGFQNNAG